MRSEERIRARRRGGEERAGARRRICLELPYGVGIVGKVGNELGRTQ